MKCEKCHKEIEEGQKYCLACQQKQIDNVKKVVIPLIGAVGVGTIKKLAKVVIKNKI